MNRSWQYFLKNHISLTRAQRVLTYHLIYVPCVFAFKRKKPELISIKIQLLWVSIFKVRRKILAVLIFIVEIKIPVISVFIVEIKIPMLSVFIVGIKILAVSVSVSVFRVWIKISAVSVFIVGIKIRWYWFYIGNENTGSIGIYSGNKSKTPVSVFNAGENIVSFYFQNRWQ